MKRHFRVFVGVFLFLFFGDSALPRGQGLIENPPYLICEPQGENGKMCLSQTYIDGLLGNRIPMILIHGWDAKEIPGRPNTILWHPLTSNLQSKEWFSEQYKFYTLTYYSNIQTIREMGLIFRDLLDRMDEADLAFRLKPLVMIGHSMGGLIARSFMQEPRFGSAGFGGDRILRLITLGTLHHGSPFANGPARDKKAGWWLEFLHRFVDGGLFGYDVRWDKENRSDLLWDNYNNLLDYERFRTEKNDWLTGLNSAGDTFERKIVAYGGRLKGLDKVDECLVGLGLISPACLATIMNHALGVSESDGFVPLSSALFEPCENCVAARIFSGYDHSEIARGKFRIFGQPEPLFEAIASDLLSVIVPRAPGFDGYVDLGNPADERFHNLRGWGSVNPGLLPCPDTDRTSRYQLLRGSNSVDLFVGKVNSPYRFTFRSEDGHCDDNFDVYVNDRLVYRYTHRGPPTDFPIHNVSIPAELVTNSRVRVTFQNLSRDNCGLAAIYYVRLDPV